MKQETVFVKQNTGETVFTFPFLYSIEAGKSIFHKYSIGSESYLDAYQIIEVDCDVVHDNIKIVRRFGVYKIAE
jgi:hypothetical protein